MGKGLSRFEEFAEKLVEGTFQKLSRQRLEPVEIARRLSRAMEDNQAISAGKVFVPNLYRVGLHPKTFQEFVSFKEPLEEELASYLADEAERQGFHFIGRPHVVVREETQVQPGRLSIHAELAGGGTAAHEVDVTQALHADEIQAAAQAGYPASGETLELVIGERVLPLNDPPINIGRSLENDVIVQSRGVSRRHAQIVFRHGRWLLRDLDSTHGTRVNGRTVQECVLRTGDTIVFGDVTAELRQAPPTTPDEEPDVEP